MNGNFRRTLCALAMAGATGTVAANCDDVIDIDYASALGASNAAYAQQIVSSSPECFGGGPTTSLVQMNGTMFQQAQAISSAIAGRQLADGPGPVAAAGMRGAAAGGKPGLLNFWGSLGETDTRQRYAALPGYSNGTVRNDMDVVNAVIGLDYAFSPTLLAGVSVAADRGDGNGSNTDPAFSRNRIRSEGYVVAPYLGWQINRDFSLDASLGFGSGQVRTHTTNRVESDRWYAAANLNYARWVGNLQFSGRASLLHGVERYGDIKVRGVSQAGTDATNTLDQGRLSAQVGYWMNGVMPYAAVTYVHDLHRKTTQFGAPSNPIGRSAWEWRLGANFFSLASGVTGGVYFAQEEGRTKQRAHSLLANINFRF